MDKPVASLVDKAKQLERENAALREALKRESARTTAANHRAELAEGQVHIMARVLANGRPPERPQSGPCRTIIAEGRLVHAHPRVRNDPESA